MGDEGHDAAANDIAVIGMAARVPGARNVAEFWRNLVEGVESIRDLTPEELSLAEAAGDRVYDPRYVGRTAELPDMEMFDADFFGLSPKEAAIMDPQHRQFLECAWEAMEDAGRMPDAAGGPVGVFAGCGMGSYFYFNLCSNRALMEEVGLFLLRHTGNDKDFLSTRASFLFDLRGPSINIQTACSTSLVAVHAACQSLLAGECETALAGGVTIELPHRRGYLHQEGEILSPDGRCRPFDHRAAGTVFGSGAGVVVLRRLSDALADGDPIHAVIKASAVNNDGAGKAGYLAPSVTGQAEAVIEAQGLGGIDAETIGYVECHGTGTFLGDPIEVEALTQAFRQSTDASGFCRIGSVKSNIGHLDTAAGVVGLIKAVLCVKHGRIPPTLGFEKANPSIPFETSPFRVADRLEDWPSGAGPRRAAINSLGVGGTNAHAIIEEAPAPRAVVRAVPGAASDTAEELLFLSAKHKSGLDEAGRRLADALAERPDLSLADAAHTLLAGRRHFEHRRVVVASGREAAVAALRKESGHVFFDQTLVPQAGEPAFLFPGGGAQHVGMARSLAAGDPGFRATVDEGLAALEPEAAAEIRSVWFAQGEARARAEAQFLRPSLQLPAILIVEVALARWWIARGLRPSVLIGHSMGENAAACVAGVLSLQDAVRLVRLRGELFETVEPGGMLSISLGAEALAAILPDALDMASQNAPELCVVSGRNADLEAFAQDLERQGVESRRVPIDIAAHSRMLEPILPRFEAFVRSIRLQPATIPIVSNRTGGWLSARDATDPLYWVRHLRSTVEFGRGMALLAERAGRIFIEMGPGRTLSSLAKLQPGIGTAQVFNSLPHADDPANDAHHLLAAYGRAFAAGLDLPVERLTQGRAVRRVSLPTYPFQRQRYFIERAAPAAAASQDAPLRRIPDMADWGWRPGWRRSAPGLVLGKTLEGEPGSFLVFLDPEGFGLPIVEALRRKGHDVVTVELADLFTRHSRDSYGLSPAEGRAGYEALASALSARGPLSRTILHLWMISQTCDLARAKSQGFFSLIHLGQALGDAVSPEEPLSLVVATNGMHRVGDERPVHPEKALVLGPGLVLPKEMPGLSVRLLDIDPILGERRKETTNEALNQRILDELLAEPSNEVAALRGSSRWTRIHERLPLPPGGAESAPTIRRDGVYLVTGGLGDLGLAIGKSLCEDHGARIVLIGRTALPPRGEWPAQMRARVRADRLRGAMERIAALESQGHRVHVVQGDAADPQALARIAADIRKEFGRIDGVFHAAGLVDDGLVATKTDAALEAVLVPKVEGTAALEAVFAADPLDLLVLFSSTSTDTAPAGQADYVAANSYLNAYAEAGGRAARRTLAIHWGVWSEIGLAARAMSSSAPAVSHVLSAATDAKGPFFERLEEDGDGVTWALATLSPATHWLLNEHRLVTGEAVMPGTGYVEIIAQLVRELGFTHPMAIEDLVFLRPLLVGDERPVVLRASLRGDGRGFRAAIEAGSGDEFEAVAEARLAPPAFDGGASGTPLDLGALRAACGPAAMAEGGKALASAQEGHIRFGPRWSVLRSLAIGPDVAIADLALSDTFAGDDTLAHPALLDIATGFAMELVPDFRATEVLWAPMSYGRIDIRAPLPASITSVASLEPAELGEGFASFDVTLTDASGAILGRIERFVMRRLDSDVAFSASRPSPARGEGPRAAASSPDAARLEAQVRQGILPHEGVELLRRALASGETEPILSSLDLPRLVADAARGMEADEKGDGVRFDRPDLDTNFVAPRTELELTLAAFWTELLGIERIGVDDDFFDIGGHSLIAVRLFRKIRAAFGVDLPISVLYEAPTIAGCAALIEAARPQGGEEASLLAEGAPAGEAPRRPTHLVAMSNQPNARGTPFFLCAGMFGNILNLRELARRLGVDRPVYGLQAQGLLEGEEPQETFEEMARSCLAELRTVQPHGPYLLGGFSGGGITAYEMAQQLRAEGEEVALVVMLDTPLPSSMPLDLTDRLHMKWQDLRRDGRDFVKRWRASRAEWSEALALGQAAATGDAGEERLRSARIEAAFRAALPRYQARPYDGRVLLLRPRLEIVYRLRGGRRLQPGRNAALDDNGWSPLVDDLVVREVPGDHDAMVLEPFVPVLVDRLAPELRRAESGAAAKAIPAKMRTGSASRIA